jgi:hypothetical protein
MTATAPAPAPSPRRSRRRLARAAVLTAAAAATTAAGVFISGGVITNDFRLSMLLTAAWFAAAGAASLASLKAGRSIGLPILAGYLIAATAIGAYLAATTLVDRTVNETVVTGTPASEMPATQEDATREPKPRNVEETRGSFVSGEHTTRGTARTIRLANGRRVLTLTGFETDAGPDLRVRIVPGKSTDGGAGNAVDLGALKGNKGDQQYDLPKDLKPRNHTVVIWCRAFSALFGSAELRSA